MNNPFFHKAIALLMYAGIAMSAAPAQAEDWPMYGRDWTRNAVSPEKNPPVDWQIEMPTKNVKWSATLGNTTVGAPVISGGLVWICTNNEGHRDPKFTKDAGCLMCFNERDGQFRWQHLSARIGERIHDWPESSTGSPPLVEGDRLWFVSNRWEVICLDIGPLLKGTGEPRELWNLDMPRELGVWGQSPSMAMNLRCTIGASYHGVIYVITGNGLDDTHKIIPAPDAPGLIAVNKETGKVIWSDHSVGGNILDGQYGSALVGEIAGKAQVIAAQGDGWLRSFDPATGKLIWKFDTNPKKTVYPQTRNTLVAPPVLYENRLYITQGQCAEHGEGLGVLWCVDPTREGDISDELDDGPLPLSGKAIESRYGSRRGKPNPNSGVIWKFDQIPGTPPGKAKIEDRMNRVLGSVAVAEGFVICADYSGFVHCLDAKTGQRYWVHNTESAIFGSPLICDGKVYVGCDDGFVRILELAREKKPIAERDVGAPILCSPVMANGVLYVATRSTLYAISGSAGMANEEWPQWRGPERTNISPEAGLLAEWPPEGPPLLWKATGLGEGVPSVAVAGGRVYTLGYQQRSDILTAWDAASGKAIWHARVGPAIAEMVSMRWLSQRTPTVDDDRIYVVTAAGELICLATADGAERWRKSYRDDFTGKPGSWGFCDYPLVDGQRLICTPGGEGASMVALDKHTGDVLWNCEVPGCRSATYSAVIATNLVGVRQYVQQFDTGVASVSTEGKILWQYDQLRDGRGNVHTAIAVDGEQIFCSCGWGVGDVLLKVTREGEHFTAVEQYRDRNGSKAFESWIGNSSLVGGYVYTNNGYCIEEKSGHVNWSAKLGNRITSVVADGRMYYRLTDGTMVLGEVYPEKYVERGRFLPPRLTTEPAWSSPVIAGGRLYLRDQDELLCYDLRKDRSKAFESPAKHSPATARLASQPSTAPKSATQHRPSDPIFVPTPQDVVEKMLELAAVKKDDVVYDLGCGDGRIVVTAARKYGCRAAGYDIDAECVRMSRENVRKHDVEALVDIAQKNVFTLDVSPATVVTLYMGREVNLKLVPQLQTLKPGSRIVSHNFDIEGFKPDKVIEFKSAEDDTNHSLYIWTAPLKKKAD